MGAGAASLPQRDADRLPLRVVLLPEDLDGGSGQGRGEVLQGALTPAHYYGSRLLYAGVPENDVADWMGHSGTDVLREHYHYVFEGAEQRGRAPIATMLTPGADDPTEASEVA